MISAATEDQEELRALCRGFLADKAPVARTQALVDAGAAYDEAVWAQLASQLGLQGIAVPAEHGGAGMGPVELGIVCAELGRVLYLGPFFSTVVLAAQALSTGTDEAAKARWLPSIAAGELTATLAVADATGELDVDAIATTASPDGEGWTLTGTKRFVVDGASAELLLVAASVDGVPALFAVAGSAAGLVREPLPTLDPTRALATVTLDATPATRIEGDAAYVLGRVGDLTLACLANEQAGGASAALEMAVDYAKVRTQFERPIGSFQAIKHKCADLLLAVESARNGAFAATALLAVDDAEGPIAAHLAAAWCALAFTSAAKENIQIHGGIGFTWEHPAHLYLKRAKTSEQLFGSPVHHRARVADLAGV